MIKFHCQKCNQKLGVQDDYAGRRVCCPNCSIVAVIPQPQFSGLEINNPNNMTMYSVFICRDENEKEDDDETLMQDYVM